MTPSPDWICCQLGAREHYAVPRALHRHGRLRLMITDAWMRPGNPIAHVPNDLARRLAERFHPDLDSAEVHDLTLSLLKQEVEWRLRGRQGWDLVIARNEWFQREAATVVARAETPTSQPIAVFAYSNSAREVFRAAKARGWTTVLGQIDPGEEHFTIVQRLADASPQYGPPPPAPPPSYFDAWRDECALADHIVVNSDWSRRAIVRAGVDAKKIQLLPLAYDHSAVPSPERSLPDRFTPERPLRLLFVGSVSVVKGVAALLEAMAGLGDLPVSLRLVGPPSMVIPPAAQRLSSIEFVGPQPRGDVRRQYETSDVLMFPSHSDGFGLVQIEAQASGLPIVASLNCGQVVEDGRNGILLPEVTAPAIADAIRRLVTTPSLVAGLSRQSVTSEQSTLQGLGDALLRMVKP